MCRILIFAVLLLAAPSAWSQDLCIFPTGEACNMTAICVDDCVGSISCSGGDNVCDDADNFQMDAVITVPDGSTIAWNPSGLTRTWTVQQNGDLKINGGAVFQNNADLIIDPNGRVTPEGLFLPGPSESVAWPAQADDPKPEALDPMRVSQIIHCPGIAGGLVVPDCDENAATTPGDHGEIALCWPESLHPKDGFGAEPFYEEWVELIEVGHQIVFFDWTGGDDPPRDVNSPFPVVDVSQATSTQHCIYLDATQACTGGGCPHDPTTVAPAIDHEEKKIQIAQISGAHALHAVTISIASADNTDGADDPVEAETGGNVQLKGRYLHCPDADGEFPGPAAMIMSSTHGGTTTDDTLTLWDNGFPTALADTTECRIDYGWQRGDQLYAMDPAVIRSTTASLLDGHIVVSGTLDMDGTLIDTGTIHGCSAKGSSCYGASVGVAQSIEGDNVIFNGFTDLWLAGLSGKTIERWMAIGTSPTATTHVFLNTQPILNTTMSNWSARYYSDDVWQLDDNPGAGTGETRWVGVRIKKPRASMQSCNELTGCSIGILSSNAAFGLTPYGTAGSTPVEVEDLLCESCISSNGLGSSLAVVFNSGVDVTWNVNGGVVMATEAPLTLPGDPNNPVTSLSNFYVERNIVAGGLIPFQSRIHMKALSSINLSYAVSMNSGLQAGRIEQVLIKGSVDTNNINNDVMWKAHDLTTAPLGPTVDLAIINASAGAVAANNFAFRCVNTNRLRDYDRVTFGWTRDFAGNYVDHVTDVGFCDNVPVTESVLKNFLITGFRAAVAANNGAVDRFASSTLQHGDGWLLTDNLAVDTGGTGDARTPLLSLLTADTYRGRAIDFVDASCGHFEIAPGQFGAGVYGARNSGAPPDLWGLKVMDYDICQNKNSWKCPVAPFESGSGGGGGGRGPRAR